MSFDLAAGTGSAWMDLSPRGRKRFSDFLSIKREGVETWRKGLGLRLNGDAGEGVRRIHVGWDASCGQVFPNKSLSSVPVKASRGVADAWKVDTRCHKKKRRGRDVFIHKN